VANGRKVSYVIIGENENPIPSISAWRIGMNRIRKNETKLPPRKLIFNTANNARNAALENENQFAIFMEVRLPDLRFVRTGIKIII
jgi:hypothetical protein